jgi:protein-S-isoprenylcysteine O-methyltransferase Ste14
MAISVRQAPRISSRSRENLAWIVPLALLLGFRAATGAVPGPSSALLSVSAMGLMLLGVAVRLTARQWKAERCGDGLVTDGLYAYLRHPLYLGSFLLGAGLALLLADPLLLGAFVVLFWLSHVSVLRREEAELEAVFGEAYREYRSCVPGLLPRFDRPRRVLPQRLDEAILRESDALCAVLALPLVLHLALSLRQPAPGGWQVPLLLFALATVVVVWARLKLDYRILITRERRERAARGA